MKLKQRAEEFARDAANKCCPAANETDSHWAMHFEGVRDAYIKAAKKWAEKGFKAARERPTKWDDPPDVYSTFGEWWKEVEGE